MEDVISSLVVLIIVFGIVAALFILNRESFLDQKASGEVEIEKWAHENNYQIRAMELKNLPVGGQIGQFGPFIGKADPQMVYRVVITPLGEEKRRVAWIRCGVATWGAEEKMTLIWEDEWRPSDPPAG
jgi:hypothetical protein